VSFRERELSAADNSYRRIFNLVDPALAISKGGMPKFELALP
jgi:hypothetical protein